MWSWISWSIMTLLWCCQGKCLISWECKNLLRGVTTCDKRVTHFLGHSEYIYIYTHIYTYMYIYIYINMQQLLYVEEYHVQHPPISGCLGFKKNTTNQPTNQPTKQPPKHFNSQLHHFHCYRCLGPNIRQARWDHAQLHGQHSIQLPRQWEAHFQRLPGASTGVSIWKFISAWDWQMITRKDTSVQSMSSCHDNFGLPTSQFVHDADEVLIMVKFRIEPSTLMT